MRLGLLVGSLSATSINRMLIGGIADLIGARAQLQRLPVAALPLFDRDLVDELPQAARALHAEVRRLDGLIIATPEHNRSVPTVLKNVLDWGSIPDGQSVWAGLPTGIVGAATGAIGTAAAQQHLRSILGHLDMPTLGQPEVFLRHDPVAYGADGLIVDASLRTFLAGWVEAYLAHVRLHAQARERAA